MPVPYYELPGLEAVYLEDSFVTRLIESDREISFLLDLVLRESHPRYSPPKSDERYCFRPAKLTFANPRRVTWERKDLDRPGIDASGEIDYGNIDWMYALDRGTYRLDGNWGVAVIASDPPVIQLL
jgi:hypothetical protein